MSCGGNMMRMSYQPLAHLVDAAAEKWLAVEHAPEREQRVISNEITTVSSTITTALKGRKAEMSGSSLDEVS
jgi:hypothetical protein